MSPTTATASRPGRSEAQRARFVLVGGSVFVVALALYVRTLLPDVGTWDTAEFQAIGPVLGIAHPTGYPTYTLLAWLASVVLQPFGNEAYRADLLSALLMAGAAALATLATMQLTRRWLISVVAGLAFAITPIAWRVGVRADPHALHVFLAALMLVLLITWMQRQRAAAAGTASRPAGRWLVAATVVFGLSLGNHALTLLLAPGIALFVLLVEPRIMWRQWRLVLLCLTALTLTTAAVYAYLPIRSAMDPPLDYASPRTWESFWYVVLGQQFQGSFRGLPPLAEMVAGIWDELVRNLGPVIKLVPAGAVLGAIRHWRIVTLTGLWFVSTWVFALGYPNAIIERYYLVPLLVARIWVALAADYAWDKLRDLLHTFGVEERGWADYSLGAVLAVVLLSGTVAAIPDRLGRLDASGSTFGRDWLEATFAALEPNAAVVSWWSYSTPLWYGRWVEGRRDDIVIIDDRDVLDDGYGTAEEAVEHFLGKRPVYVIRLERDLLRLRELYRLERVETVPSPGDLYRVLGRRNRTSARQHRIGA
ncbi:MAG: protein O-mannosyl-transferase family [Chloroflexota bacterium]